MDGGLLVRTRRAFIGCAADGLLETTALGLTVPQSLPPRG
jgi:hypothetical protein